MSTTHRVNEICLFDIKHSSTPTYFSTNVYHRRNALRQAMTNLFKINIKSHAMTYDALIAINVNSSGLHMAGCGFFGVDTRHWPYRRRTQRIFFVFTANT